MNKAYRLNLSFYGKDFLGWQSQKDFSPTVQDELNKSLRSIFKSEKVQSIACGRTDSGVSSICLIVKILVPFSIPESSLLKAINSSLPESIRVLDIRKSCLDFHPIFQAKSRTYKYLFTTNTVNNPFECLLMPNIKYDLDWDLIEQAAKVFEGRHDFRDFMCVGSDVESTVREIFSLKVHRSISANLQGLVGSYHCIEVTGNGFLKQMVRLIVGTLWNIGRKKVSLEDLRLSLSVPSGNRLGAVAPAKGLYKVSTSY